jgi:hypothetical protein
VSRALATLCLGTAHAELCELSAARAFAKHRHAPDDLFDAVAAAGLYGRMAVSMVMTMTTINATSHDISVCPEVFAMSSFETLPLAFDVSGLLLTGETPSSPSARLVQMDTGMDYASGHPGSPVIQGTQLIQTVTALQVGKRYRLIIQFTAAAGKVWAPSLLIECPE